MFLQRGEVFSAPRAPFVYRNGTERSVAAFRSFDRASILEHRLPFRKSFASEISLASLLNYPSAHSFNVFVSCVCCVYFFKKRRYLYINLQAEYRCLSRYLSSRLYILLHIMYIYICIYRFKFWIFRFEKFVRDDWTKLFLSISPETLHKRIKRTESKIV